MTWFFSNLADSGNPLMFFGVLLAVALLCGALKCTGSSKPSLPSLSDVLDDLDGEIAAHPSPQDPADTRELLAQIYAAFEAIDQQWTACRVTDGLDAATEIYGAALRLSGSIFQEISLLEASAQMYEGQKFAAQDRLGELNAEISQRYGVSCKAERAERNRKQKILGAAAANGAECRKHIKALEDLSARQSLYIRRCRQTIGRHFGKAGREWERTQL